LIGQAAIFNSLSTEQQVKRVLLEGESPVPQGDPAAVPQPLDHR
jgi:hypothetical protein